MLEDKKLRIAVFPSDAFGCGYYRLIQAGEKLIERGHKVDFFMSMDEYETRTKQVFKVKNELNPLNERTMAHANYDVYHFQRVTTPQGLRLIKDALTRGVVLMDMDDDLFNLYPGHPSLWYFQKGSECMTCHNTHLTYEDVKCSACGGEVLEKQDRLKCCGDAIGIVDCLTVSTPEIYDRYGKSAKRCVVIPNYVDMNLYRELIDKGDDYTAVGWAGSFTHTKDFGEISLGIEQLNNHDKTYFMSVGEPDMDGALGNGLLNPGKLIQLAPVHVLKYPQILKNFDIGLAPIVDNAFNRQKSELKAIEYGAARVVGIYSDVAPYSRYVKHGETGFLCKRPRDWKKYLKLLLEDKELRKKMAQAAYEQAETMDINVKVADRENLYYKLVGEKNG